MLFIASRFDQYLQRISDVDKFTIWIQNKEITCLRTGVVSMCTEWQQFLSYWRLLKERWSQDESGDVFQALFDVQLKVTISRWKVWVGYIFEAPQKRSSNEYYNIIIMSGLLGWRHFCMHIS